MPEETREEKVCSMFSDYLKKKYSRYEAVRRTADSLGITMREVGLILHPAGCKHKAKAEGADHE